MRVIVINNNNNNNGLTIVIIITIFVLVAIVVDPAAPTPVKQFCSHWALLSSRIACSAGPEKELWAGSATSKCIWRKSMEKECNMFNIKCYISFVFNMIFDKILDITFIVP